MSMSSDKSRVLYVYDEMETAGQIESSPIHNKDEFIVSTATSASEGLDRLANEEYACVVSGYSLPGMNGIQFLKRIREKYPDLPFILYTGKGSEQVASDAIRAGATDYVRQRSGTDHTTLVTNRLQNAVARYRSQQRAEDHQRITDVIRNLNGALVRSDTVAEIEQNVCSILNNADPYLATCIAEVNTGTMEIEPRTWAGDTDGYFEILDMCVAEGAPGRQAPGGRAYHDREIAISQDISEDPQYEQWRDDATDRGFQSLGVVPLEYDETLYGLLAMFADRRYAFDETEQELLTELGDDIAHAIQARKAESSLQIRSRAMDEAPVGITITDPDKPDNPMVYVNQGFTAVTGYTKAEAVGKNHRILQGAATADEPVAAMRKAIDNEKPVTVELRNYRKNGESFWNRVSIAPVYDDDGGLMNFVGFQQDITDRKESEQELRRNERRFEAMLNDPNILVVVVDINGTVLDVNETAMEYIDVSLRDVKGLDVWESPWFSEEHQSLIKTTVKKAADGEYVTYEADLTYPNGDPYNLNGMVRPVTDEYGEIVSIIISARDVTELKERTRHLHVVDNFLRHNIRNNLNVIRGRATDLHEELDGDFEASAEAIVNQANDLCDTSEKSRAVVSVLIGDKKPITVEIQSLIEKVATRLSKEWPDTTIEVTETTSCTVTAISSLESALEELFTNAIIHNDSENTHVGVTLTVNDDTAILTIRDNGPGLVRFDTNVLESGNAIEDISHGSGLGLWLVYWTIKRSDGTIQVDESATGGTAITIRLPVVTNRTDSN